MLAGIARVIAGFFITVMMWGGWLLFICGVMAISLYVARLVPLAGKRRR
jgi:hypothetical protein